MGLGHINKCPDSGPTARLPWHRASRAKYDTKARCQMPLSTIFFILKIIFGAIGVICLMLYILDRQLHKDQYVKPENKTKERRK